MSAMPVEPLKAITCPRCQSKSYNPNDVAEGYCGKCHAFTKGEVTVEDGREG